MATYSISNFLGTPVEGDTTLKIYDKTRKLRYEINPNIAYFFTKSNIVIIRIEDKNDIYLDFENSAEAAQATAQLNLAKQQITNPPVPACGTGTLPESEQLTISYFHSLSKLMTTEGQTIIEPKYKSSHNVPLSEVWGDVIHPCTTYAQATGQTLTNSAVTLHYQVELTSVSDSNGQAWYYNNGYRFVRPWIGPLDVPFPDTNLPSLGFTLLLYRGDDATKGVPGSAIGPLVGAWAPDYYAGVIHFGKGNTPHDLGWGTIKATFFEYTGTFGVPGVTNAFTTAAFDSGTSELVFNSGQTTEERVYIPTTMDAVSLSTAISVETSKRIAGDSLLSTSLSTETSGRTSADLSLSTSLSTESSTRMSVDNSLSVGLSTTLSKDISLSTEVSVETSKRISSDLSLSTAISGETTMRISGDQSLSLGLSTTLSKDTSLSTALSVETSGRTSADLSLSSAVSTSLSKDTSLSTGLSTEISTRTSNVVSLSTGLSTEISTRTSNVVSLSTAVSTTASKDISLSSALSTEKVVRGSADTSLSTGLSTEISTRTSNVTSLSTAVSTTASKDISLSTALSTEISTRGSSDTSLSSAVSTEKSIRTSADISLSNAIVGVGGPSLSIALSTEISTRSSADASLSSRLSAEISTRSSADTSLSTGLSTEISTRTSNITSLSTELSDEISTRTSIDTSLSTAVSITASKDISLSTALSTEMGIRGSADVSLTTAVSTTASKDISLSTALSTEIGVRGSADTSLSTGLSTEISTRTSNVVSLSTAASVTASKDISLSTALSTEIVVRSSSDTSLSTAIVTGDSMTLSSAKSYADAVAQGVSPHAPVRVVSTGNTSLWGVQYVDGIFMSTSGESVLVVGQTIKTQNGIYTVNISGTWPRRSDADGAPNNEVELGDFVFVESGLTNASSGWVLGKTDATGSTITPDVNTQEWYKMAAPGSYTASGIGINLVGNMFNISSEISTRTGVDASLAASISALSSMNSSLSTSIAQTITGLTSLTSAVSTETSLRVSGDVSLSSAISKETSLRVSGDISLSTTVSTEISQRISGDTSLSSAISKETSQRISGDTSLSSVMSTEIILRTSGDTSLSSAISKETSQRISGDTSLSSVISTEISTRTSGDLSLSSAISLISSGSSVGVNSLSIALSTEILLRTSGDTSLSSAISKETSLRISGDTSLSSAISKETSIRTSVDTSLSSALSSERTSRISGDTSLSSALSAEISTVGSEIVSLSEAISSVAPGGSSLIIQDEFGVVLTGVTVINFIGVGVRAQNGSSGTTNRVNVFIPPPAYASHFNTLDGTTYPTVAPLTTTNRYIALPTTEGNPYKIGTWGGGEIHPAIRSGVTPSYFTADNFSILDTTTTFTVTVFDANGTTPLATHVTTLSGNNSVTLSNITIITTGWTSDSGKYMASVTVNIALASILPQGGRFSVLLRHNDGIDGVYSFTQNDVFRDSETLTANIGGTLTVLPEVPVIKQISGVFYYTTGSQWHVNLQSINNVNSRSYPTTEQLKIVGDNLFISETLNINGEDNLYDSFSGGTWTRQHDTTGAKYDKTNWTTDLLDRTNWLSIGGISGNTALATLYDWTSVTGKTSADYNYLIDTFVDLSDRNSEMFRTETFRLQSNLSTPWDSSFNLTGGTGLQVLADRLVYPKYDFTSYLPNTSSQPDYSGLTGTKYYYRKFTTNGYNVSNGIIQFTDYNITESDLSSNYVKFEISIDSGATWYTLNSQYVGGVLYNGAGCRVDVLEYGLGVGTIDSNALRFTLGQMQISPPLGSTTFIHLKITFTVNATTKYIGGIDLIGGNWI